MGKPDPGERGAAGEADGPGDAEVGDDRVAVGEQDVLGLDVAVDHPAPVGVVQRVGHLRRRSSTASVDREPSSRHQPVAQRLAVHERHHRVQQAGGLARLDAAAGCAGAAAGR